LEDNRTSRRKLGPTRKRFGGRLNKVHKGRGLDGFLRDGKGIRLRKRGHDDLRNKRWSLFWKDNWH
jgi:hypothetical protein